MSVERLREIIGQFAQRALDAGENRSLVESRRAEAEEIVADLVAQVRAWEQKNA